MSSTFPTRDPPLDAVGSFVDGNQELSDWLFGVALAAGLWFFFIIVVQAIGSTEL